eukprot:g191.t1
MKVNTKKRKKRDNHTEDGDVECISNDTCGSISPASKGTKKRKVKEITEGSVSRKVTFASDVKENDGLRPSSKIFEDIMFSCCVGKKTLNAKQILLYIEKHTESLFETFDRVKELCADGLVRLRDAMTQTSRTKHVPFLNGGGGRGYGFMQNDVASLVLVRKILDEASELLVIYKESLGHTSEQSLGKKTEFSPSPVSVFLKHPVQPPSPVEV